MHHHVDIYDTIQTITKKRDMHMTYMMQWKNYTLTVTITTATPFSRDSWNSFLASSGVTDGTAWGNTFATTQKWTLIAVS